MYVKIIIIFFFFFFFLSFFLVVFIFLPPSLCDETQKSGGSGVGHLGIQLRNWKECMIFCKFHQFGARSLLQSLASIFLESVLYVWTLLWFFRSLFNLSLSLSLSLQLLATNIVHDSCVPSKPDQNLFFF
jgi:hypothetical protein